MSKVQAKHLATLLKQQAAAVLNKSASSSTGAPSTADGVAQVTAGSVTPDPGNAELRANSLPANAEPSDDTDTLVPGKNLNPSATPNADKAAPAELPKMAAERVARVRNALTAVLPSAQKAPTPTQSQPSVADQHKSAASETALDLSPEMLVKLAKAVLSTNEGVAFAHYTLEKAAGAAHADQMIKAAHAAAVAHDEVLFTKQAAFDEGMQRATNIHRELSSLISESDADSILKQASLHTKNLDELEHPLLKMAYAAGMDDAHALEAAEEAGEGEPALPMGGEELTMEDVIALLEEMIANGDISKEEVEAGLKELEASQGAAQGETAPNPAQAAPK